MNLTKMIAESGFAIMGVGSGLPFNYTVGLQLTLSHPELVLSTVPLEAAGQFLHAAFYAIEKTGFRFRPGQKLLNFMTDAPFVTIAVAPRYFQDHFAQVRFFFDTLPDWNREHEAVQLVLADSKGQFPWELGYDGDLFPQWEFGEFEGVEETIDMRGVLAQAQRILQIEQSN